MSRRSLIFRIVVVSLLAGAALRAQEPKPGPAEALLAANRDAPVIAEISFSGLRRISPAALQNKIALRSGDALDSRRVAGDVRVLARLGWFEDVRAEISGADDSADFGPSRQKLRLSFHVPELPFLTGVEFRGSRLLSRPQIDRRLAEKKLLPRLGEPANPAALHRMAQEIESTLAELSHPQARVQIQQQKSPQATVRVRFEISDGPHLPVGRVIFAGHPEISPKVLRRQLRAVNPQAWLAGLRQKNSFTPEAFEKDRGRLLAYYQNHGYPEARIGLANVAEYQMSSRWLPWPRAPNKWRLQVTIPAEAGRFYRLGSLDASPALQLAAGIRPDDLGVPSPSPTGRMFSALQVENLRRAWEMRVRDKTRQAGTTPLCNIEVLRTLDPDAHSVRVRFDLSSSPPYTVRRLEFRGMRRFPDRYFRRRIGVKEGTVLDERALEAGLARLARTGYFRPIKKEDVHIEPDDSARSVDVVIRLEELGKQRVSMMGGRGQFGSTLGIAYSLFNLFDREELLTSRIEGGPESLELALSFAKQGFLGSRGSLALSVFNTFLRPHLTGSVKGPFFRMRSEGATADYSYALTAKDILSANYGLSRSETSYSPALPLALSGFTPGDIRARSSSHSIGAGWTRDAGNQQIVFADSVSGGWLGGSENLLRSKTEYRRIFRDPLFRAQNAWAFRTTLSGVGSYSGDMPLSARWFAGDEFVRGLREGELGPQALIASATSSGAPRYLATPAGSNLIAAGNAEYRIRLGGDIEAAGFFDAGSGWLLPNWLGKARPVLFDATNGIVHGSTGLELRWTLPGIAVPVRAYYAVNVLRLDRSAFLPDGSRLLLHNRLGAFGWGLGSLF